MDNRVSLNKLEIFQRVVELGSASEAGRALHIAQPAVSEHIRSLEERVGHKLFERRNRGLTLTVAGETLAASTRAVISRTRELERQLEGLDDASVGAAVVGASTTVGSYLLARLVADFTQSRPGAEISVRTYVRDRAIDGVRNGELDFGIIASAIGMDEPDIAATPLLDEPYVLVTGAASDIPGSIPVERIPELRFVCSPRISPRVDLIDAPLEALGLRRRIVVEFTHPEAIKRAVLQNFGVAFLMRSAVEDELAAGALRAIEVEGFELSAQVFEIHREDRNFSPLQRDLVDAIRAGLLERADRLRGSVAGPRSRS